MLVVLLNTVRREQAAEDHTRRLRWKNSTCWLSQPSLYIIAENPTCDKCTPSP